MAFTLSRHGYKIRPAKTAAEKAAALTVPWSLVKNAEVTGSRTRLANVPTYDEYGNATIVAQTITETASAYVSLAGAESLAANVTALPAILKDAADYSTQSLSLLGKNRLIVHKAPFGTAASFVLPSSVTGGLRVVTSKEVEGFRVTLSCPALYQVSGGFASTDVRVGIFYRPLPKAAPGTAGYNDAPWVVYDAEYVISANSPRAEVLRSFEVANLALDYYELLFVRNTEDHTGSTDFIDAVYVKEITEILNQKLRYNNTALLGLKIRATDQLSGNLPTITSLVKGTKVAVPSNLKNTERYDSNGNYLAAAVASAYAAGWDGTLSWDEATHTGTKHWTDNPVWCLYDLLTNERYGLREYYKIDDSKLPMMRANFYLMAKYCDEGVTYTEDGVVKTRPRFSLNIVLDQSKSAGEWINTIASIMRASIFYNEGIFWVEIDRPKFVSQIFNMSNIKDFSQTGTSYRSIPNTYEVQWVNKDMGYEVDIFRLEDPDVYSNSSIEERKKALMLIGVTNFDQAKSLAKFALLAGKHRTKLISFKTGTHGLHSMVADVIGVQHDVPQWGWGGKVTAWESAGVEQTTLTLSSPFDYPAGSTGLKLFVTQSGQMPFELDVVEPSTGTLGINALTVYTTYTPQSGVGSATYVPAPGDTYILGMVPNSTNKFKIVNIKRDTDEMVEIMAVEYDEQIYALSDNTSDLGAWAVRNYSLLTDPQRVSVTGVWADSEYYQDSGGQWKNAVTVYYSVPSGGFWRGAELHYNINGAASFTHVPGVDASGMFRVEGLSVSGSYKFVITSVYSSGKQSVADALADTEYHPSVIIQVDAYVPNDSFLKGVSGLEIVNQANNNTFTGKDCVVRWKKPLALDAAVATSAGGTAGTTVDTWFKHYQVTVQAVSFASEDTEFNDPILGVIKRTTTVYDEKFTYTHEMNHQDAPVARHFNVTVVAYDRLGRASAPKTILCSNPAPPAIA